MKTIYLLTETNDEGRKVILTATTDEDVAHLMAGSRNVAHGKHACTVTPLTLVEDTIAQAVAKFQAESSETALKSLNPRKAA